MTNRIPLDHLTSDQYDHLCDQLDALQAVARGYCPACGRGDAAPTVGDWEQQRQRAERAEAANERIRRLAARIRQGVPWAANFDNLADRILGALDGEPAADTQTVPGFQPARPDIPMGINPDADPLVVEPYRADDGSRKWVFRCWGTDSCDGWLSLDHTSQQWAEQARDRHVAEDHAEPGPAATQATEPARWLLAGTRDLSIPAPLTPAEEARLAQDGVDTPGCDCGHDGMGVSWHGDDCPWRRQQVDPTA